MRYTGQLLNKIKSAGGIVNYYYGSNYINLYRSGIEVFKKYPYFGTGNKNYGIETCYGKKSKKIWCNSHPHQIYFEFLAEHGIVGSIIILFIFFKIFFDLLRQINITKNKIQFASFVYILIVFMPILPGGAFFGDYCNWQRIAAYENFVRRSPASELARALMGSVKVNFFHSLMFYLDIC